MKDINRQIAVIISVLVTLVVNGLANALPLNGQNTGQISDRFNVNASAAMQAILTEPTAFEILMVGIAMKEYMV